MTSKLSLNLNRCLNSIYNSNMITRSQVRTFSSANLKVEHVPNKNRFTAELNGEFAVLEYERKNGNITFLHTEVPDVFRGKGVGKLLAEEALTYAKKNNLSIKIECDFVKKFYNDNETRFK